MNKVQDHRYQGGLWAALFLILLLPFLFIRSGVGHPTLSLPVWGLKASLPRARLVWEYYGQADHIPCWLGGELIQQQLITEAAPGMLAAVAADGAVLWTEEAPGPFKVLSDGRQLLLAADSGQVTKFISEQGVLWSEATGWDVQALALAPDGKLALAQGPVLEEQSNLLERVRLYSPDGDLLAEHIFRNNSVIRLAAASKDNWVVSTVTLTAETPQGQLARLTTEPGSTRLLWQSADIIHALAVGTRGLAAAAGDKVYVAPWDSEPYTIQPKHPAADLAWTPGEALAVIQAGDSPLAPARLILMTTGGERIWQRRLKGSCRALVVRGDEVLVADPNIVYSFSVDGDLNWCYESPAAIKGLYPLADEKEVVVTTYGNHLLLLEPPD